MFDGNKKHRLRSNTDLLQPSSHSLCSFLLDSQFESTKLKLEMLRKFERTMLFQRQDEHRQVLEQLRTQNLLLESINSHKQVQPLRSIFSRESEVERLSSGWEDQGQNDGVSSGLDEIAEDFEGENELLADSHQIQQGKKKKSSYRQTPLRDIQNRSVRCDSLIIKPSTAKWADYSEISQIKAAAASLGYKPKTRVSRPSLMNSYLLTKERELIRRELTLCKREKQLLEENQQHTREEERLRNNLSTLLSLAKQMAAILERNDCPLTKDLLSVIGRFNQFPATSIPPASTD